VRRSEHKQGDWNVYIFTADKTGPDLPNVTRETGSRDGGFGGKYY